MALCAPVITILGIIISSYALSYTKELYMYKYLRKVFFIHLAVGILWGIYTSLLIVGADIYMESWPLSFLASILFAFEVIFFTHGNIKEALERVLPSSERCIYIPVILMSLTLMAQGIVLTPGIAIAIAFAGFVFALIIELIYSVSQIYSIMRGGRLFYFWRKMILLSIGYIIYGLTYSIAGIMTMTQIIPYGLGNLLVAIFYTAKSVLIYDLMSYYQRSLKPLLEKLGRT